MTAERSRGAGRRRSGRRLGPRRATCGSPASAPGPSSTWWPGSARRRPATVVDLGCGEGALTASLAAAVAGGPGDRRRLLARDARRGRRGAVPGRVEFAPATSGTGSPPARSTSWSATPSCTGCPATSRLLARWAGRLRPAGGWPCRCPATSARPPTRCWPSCAGRRGGRGGWPTWRPAVGRRPGAGRLPGRPRPGPGWPPTSGRPPTCTCSPAPTRCSAGCAAPCCARCSPGWTTPRRRVHRRVRRGAADGLSAAPRRHDRCCPSGGCSPSAARAGAQRGVRR